MLLPSPHTFLVYVCVDGGRAWRSCVLECWGDDLTARPFVFRLGWIYAAIRLSSLMGAILVLEPPLPRASHYIYSPLTMTTVQPQPRSAISPSPLVPRVALVVGLSL
ncbi:hypothetical protein D9619_011486 [Psilocybe cf. subviscida]|uniref:Uncharacterized protein n=1 Tax=Psilocybe cf. subviscida TaxID=2480587 RepID=A0A8H5BSW5_9AGAR|nr:hypothetical protein D9619_011486 [Psilocybe cf. subviscida]